MGAMGGAAAPPAAGGGAEPLSESYSKPNKTKKSKILSLLGDESSEFKDLFDMEKAQQNIYEIETKLNEIINE
jgi:hypothetical protein